MHCMNFFYSSNISVFIYCTIIVRLLCDYRMIIARLPYDFFITTLPSALHFADAYYISANLAVLGCVA